MRKTPFRLGAVHFEGMLVQKMGLHLANVKKKIAKILFLKNTEVRMSAIQLIELVASETSQQKSSR